MYLCYSNENKELYHCHSVKSNDDVLFTSYNDVGWKKTKNIIVPNSTFSFRIESNFGYEGHKYLRFRATYNDIELKNYDSERSLCSRGLSDAFDVTPEPESWDELFFLLEKIYLKRDNWNCYSYSNGLVHFCEKYKDVSNCDKDVLMTKMIGTLLHGAFDLSIVNNMVFAPYLSLLCTISLGIIQRLYKNEEVQYNNEISDTLDILYQYLKETNQQYLLFKQLK